LFRALLGGTLAVGFSQGTPFGAEGGPNLPSIGEIPALVTSLCWLGGTASLCLASGFRDRTAALVLLALWAVAASPFAQASAILEPGPTLVAGLLMLHVAMPSRPFLSWDARNRLDPDSGWRMPNALYLASWALLIFGYAWLGATQWPNPQPLGALHFSAGFVLLHIVTFNPGWIASRPGDDPSVVFYDGTCGLCHRTIRFLLAEDAAGIRFRFAPLDSEYFRSLCAAPDSGIDTGREIPDSVVVHRPGKALLVRAEGVLDLGHQLGGGWRLLAIIVGWLPIPLLNLGYDFIARIRHRLFTRPENACPILPPHLRERFSPSA
ncbi:MAG: DCC1-like thiol-disulfide oxidoreductase family protein, partial [Myxococcota bacterium]